MKLHIFIFAALVVMVAGGKCPDGSSCGILQTCCEMKVGWGCCPVPWAECCSDKVHCCPHGYLCVPAVGLCLRGATDSIPWIEKVKSHKPSHSLVRKADAGKTCPGKNQVCPSSYTCCEMSQDNYGCCPLENAVCCADQLHCCPAGTKCNTADGNCIKEKSPKEKVYIAQPIFRGVKKTGEKEVVCPDGTEECEDGETCCMMTSGLYGCCPYSQATCCSDKETCCPHNTICTFDGMCIPEKKTVPYPFSSGKHYLPNDIPL